MNPIFHSAPLKAPTLSSQALKASSRAGYDGRQIRCYKVEACIKPINITVPVKKAGYHYEQVRDIRDIEGKSHLEIAGKYGAHKHSSQIGPIV
jgi:hypothetical protein